MDSRWRREIVEPPLCKLLLGALGATRVPAAFTERVMPAFLACAAFVGRLAAGLMRTPVPGLAAPGLGAARCRLGVFFLPDAPARVGRPTGWVRIFRNGISVTSEWFSSQPSWAGMS